MGLLLPLRQRAGRPWGARLLHLLLQVGDVGLSQLAEARDDIAVFTFSYGPVVLVGLGWGRDGEARIFQRAAGTVLNGRWDVFVTSGENDVATQLTKHEVQVAVDAFGFGVQLGLRR